MLPVSVLTYSRTLGEDVDLEEFIMSKSELSGADIKAVCSEAGMMALRERRMKVIMEDFRKHARDPRPRLDWTGTALTYCLWFQGRPRRTCCTRRRGARRRASTCEPRSLHMGRVSVDAKMHACDSYPARCAARQLTEYPGSSAT